MAFKTHIPSVDDTLFSSDMEKEGSSRRSLLVDLTNSITQEAGYQLAPESGWYFGGEFTQESGGVRINKGCIRIFNYRWDYPKLSFIEFPETLITRTNEVDFIYVDADGVIRVEPEVSIDLRNRIIIGSIRWSDSTTAMILFEYVNANAREYEKSLSSGPLIYLRGQLRVKGNANLTLRVGEGRYYHHGLSVKRNPSHPHVSELLPAQNPLPFTLTYRDGAGGFVVGASPITDVPAGIYDDNSSVGGALPTGNLQNQFWVIDRLYVEATLGIYGLGIGQTVYHTELEALNALDHGQDLFDPNPVFSAVKLHAHVLRRGGAIDLSDINQAVIFSDLRSIP